MKVLHLTTHINQGGITNYIYRLVRPLKQLGVNTYVLSSGGTQEDALRHAGAETWTKSIRTKNELSPKLYFSLPSVIQSIKHHNIQVLHAHTRVTQVMASWIHRLIKIPVITTCHGFYKHRVGRRLHPAWGDLAIGISQPVVDQLVNDFKVPQQRTRLVNNAVDLTEIDAIYSRLDRIKERRRFGLKPEDIVIGSVSRLVMDKGHDYLLRAVKQLAPAFPHIKLLIVGDGKYLKNLQALTEELNLREKVIFTGMLSNHDVIAALSTLDIFSLPATWREGFGLSIIEAMACRIPVIVTNIWSLNSLIQHKITGLLIEPKDITALAGAIEELIQDPVLRKKIGAQARQMTADLFSINRMAEQINQIYLETVCSGREAG